jgi:predicted  nucleic acid-binding Zn ribbon protein
MYKIARIKILIKNQPVDNPIDLVEDFLAMLYKNGQILINYIVEKHYGFYIATVTTSDDDSLDEKYFNKYIEDILEKVEFSYEIISDDAFSADSCHCKDHSFYVLGTYYGDDSSPVLCGDCGKEIPLMKIPYLFGEKEHFSMLSYQRMYNSVVDVWMNSLSDRFSKRQLTHYDSQLTKKGIEICNELESKTGKPVYFLLPVGEFDINKKAEKVEVCPKCGEHLSTLKSAECVDKVCDNCRLGFIDHHMFDF